MGRPREFDRDRALERAMEAFWARGYRATSVQDLVDCMGIHRGSLYGTFGDKRALFLAALERYEGMVARRLLETLEGPGSGKEAIRRFFAAKIRHAMDRRRPPGCLMTNSAIERAPPDPDAAGRVRASLEKMEGAFHRALVRARDAGELDPGRDLRALARFLTSSAQGLSVMARARPQRGILEDIVRTTLAALD